MARNGHRVRPFPTRCRGRRRHQLPGERRHLLDGQQRHLQRVQGSVLALGRRQPDGFDERRQRLLANRRAGARARCRSTSRARRIPDELHYSEYTCSNISVGDDVVANDYLSSVAAHGLPTYSYVELFNDHPGSSQNIRLNDSVGLQHRQFDPGQPDVHQDNTLIIDTEDDTQNGNNGPDHVSQHLPRAACRDGLATYVQAALPVPRGVLHQQRDRSDRARRQQRPPGRSSTRTTTSDRTRSR